jgi:hypothetical protein
MASTTQQRARRDHRWRNEICIDCPEGEAVDGVRCGPCAAAHARRAGQYLRANRKRWTADGRCVRCGRQREPERRRCATCLRADVAYNAARRQRRAA